ncbi:MAG: YbgC/FadM family acyl-CoA thioesterase [Steroidobacteraceae bacterium]|nr:YbgC/FadM family acyl-CoA thioesterase [Deltaproteobacteria bacterium]
MNIRIYYEDTDAAGVVYHANYIKYLERARTEFFRAHGFLVASLAEEGFVFPVVRIEIDFKSPAYHDDLLAVETVPLRTGGSTFTLGQRIVRQKDGKLIVDGIVTLACINREHKARRIPSAIRRLLISLTAAN